MKKRTLDTYQVRREAEKIAMNKDTWARLEGFTKTEARQMGNDAYKAAYRDKSVDMLFEIKEKEEEN